MALFLANKHPSRIMILGWWSLDAYLLYIHPQVQEWTSNMIKSMLTFEDYHMALKSENALPAALYKNQIHPDDPLIRGNPCQASTLRPKSKASIHGPKPMNWTFNCFHIYH